MPWRPILLVGAALVLFYMVDTAAFTWGPTYLDGVVDARPTWSLWRPSPICWRAGWCGLRVTDWYAATARSGCSARVRSWRPCLAVVVFAPSWPVAVLGFLVTGGGVASSRR